MHLLQDQIDFLYSSQVFAAARNGFQSHGVELNRVLVFFSKMKAIKEGLRNATFSRQDLFKVNYSNYDNVVIFGVNEMVTFYKILLIVLLLIDNYVFLTDARVRSFVSEIIET